MSPQAHDSYFFVLSLPSGHGQLYQFIVALQHATVLRRTFVVPDEVRSVDWTGMFDDFGIWDLASLNAAYDIDWTTGRDADFAAAVPEQCVLTPQEGRQLLNGGPPLWREWDAKCPDVLDLAGNTGLLFCDQQHQFCGDATAQRAAYAIYDHIQLAPELRAHVVGRRAGHRDGGYGALAVHSRRAGEGGYDWELCVNGNRRTCRGHLTGRDRTRFCDERTLRGNCAAWLDFDYQIKSPRARRHRREDYRFVLASDGTHDWTLDFAGQFAVADNADWLRALEERIRDAGDDPSARAARVAGMAASALAKSKLRGRSDLGALRATLDSVSATLLDLFSLVDATYLLGVSARARAGGGPHEGEVPPTLRPPSSLIPLSLRVGTTACDAPGHTRRTTPRCR